MLLRQTPLMTQLCQAVQLRRGCSTYTKISIFSHTNFMKCCCPSNAVLSRHLATVSNTKSASLPKNISRVINQDNVNINVLNKVRNWAVENRSKDSDTQMKTLATVIEELCSDKVMGYEECKDGRLYINILTCILEVTQGEEIQELLIKLLKRQPFVSLGAISKHAIYNDLDWLQTAVKQQIYTYLPRISSGYDIFTAYKFVRLGLVSAAGCLLLDTRTIACAGNIQPKLVIQILHMLAISKYRSKELLRELVFQLSKRPVPVNDQQLANLYFSFAHLKTVSPRALNYLEVLSSAVLDNENSIEQKYIIAILKSMGRLQWNQPLLIDKLCTRLTHPESLLPHAFTSVMSACCIVGTLPDNIKAALVPQLKVMAADPGNSTFYLRVVWSLLTFDIKSESIYKDILSEERVTALTTESEELPLHTIVSNYSKLLNIATAAKLSFGMEFPEVLKAASKMKPAIDLSTVRNELCEMMTECLSCDLAMIERDVWYPTGNIIDFRYLYDTTEKKVLLPANYMLPHDVDSSSGKTPLPSHMKWVVVFLNTFDHMTVGVGVGNPPESRRRLAQSQLKEMGYHIVNIGEAEFVSDPDRQRKLSWLKDKLGLDE